MPRTPTGRRNARADVIRAFCRWTGVRGFQHILRVEHPLLRTIWTLFTAFMLIANIGLVSLLLTHYYRFNTIENIKILRGMSVQFPHVTLCNVDPVSSDRVYCLKNIHAPGCEFAAKYVDVLEKYMTASNYSETYKNSPVMSKLEDPSMVAIFFQLIGIEAASHIGHQLDDFIISNLCELTTSEEGGILVKRKCKEAGIKPLNFVTYKHFNCYTLAITNPKMSTRAVRLSVVLYLDEEEDLNCRPHCTHEFTEWAGGKVVIHPVGTFPDIEKMGMNLLPGASNQILIEEVRQYERKHLTNKPCSREGSTPLDTVYFNMETQQFEKRKMNYTDTLCVQLHSQQVTMDTCACVDFLMPIPGSHIQQIHELPFCGNMSRVNVYKSLVCKQNVRLNNSQRFRELCPLPCEQMHYNFELTQLRWPQKPRILKYYTELKDRIYYNRKFKIYEKIEAESKINASKALRLLQGTDIFEKNLLQLDVNRPNFDTLVKYTENEEYTLPTLMSQLGGINSIFLGFTCFTLLELIELGFRLVWATWPSLTPLPNWNSGKNANVLNGEAASLNTEAAETEQEKLPSKSLQNSHVAVKQSKCPQSVISVDWNEAKGETQPEETYDTPVS